MASGQWRLWGENVPRFRFCSGHGVLDLAPPSLGTINPGPVRSQERSEKMKGWNERRKYEVYKKTESEKKRLA